MPSPILTPRPLAVLLVEDNPDDAFLLERYLRRNGFVPAIVRVETDPEMRLALESGLPPDVILADFNLPHFSGPAALQLLKSLHLDIPFVMMSGAVSEEAAVDSMRAGAQDYVTKQNLSRLVPALERELKEVADRRQKLAAELALSASEARFHRLVEAMPLGLLISDRAGHVTYANACIERLLEYPPGDIISGNVALGSLCSDLSPQSSFSPSSSSQTFEAVCTTTSGQSLDVLVGVALLNPEVSEDAREFAAFIADLSHQKKSEEILRRTEKLAVAGRLAAAIAHEINNPLEALTNCLYLVGQTNLPPEARQFLQMAQQELDRVAQITIQTLRFHRRSSRGIHADIHELLNSVLALFETRLQGLKVEIVRDFGEIPAVPAYDGEIRQVMVNLIVNAIDALPFGGRIILRTASSHHPVSGRPGVTLTVADTGCGMDPAVLRRIFEPFFSTKGITGTGLGLWVSQEIIERHQGSLRAHSRKALPGQPGSTVFRLFLPTDRDPESMDA